MSTPRSVQFLFGTIALLFVFVLVSHITSSGEVDSAFDDHSHANAPVGFADRLRPYFRSTESLGTIKDHLMRSERNYQELIQQRATLMKDYPNPNQKSFFPCDSHQAYWETPFSIWDFAPASFNCPHSIMRLGRLGDGGKWLCGLERHFKLPKTRESTLTALDHIVPPTITSGSRGVSGIQPGCIVYSFGIQFESTFEEELLKRTSACQIWGYDFSVDTFGPQLREVEAAGRAHFTKAGIAGQTDATKKPPFYAIQDLMAVNGHDHIDILKMDIEGFEFESMTSMINYFTSRGLEVPISQFLVEIHLDPGQIQVDQFMQWWELLESAGFRPVWTEPNLLVTTIPLFDGKPRYAEYTFINIKDSQSPLLN